MKAESKFLTDLIENGYFAKGRFDPQPVFDAARKHLGIDVCSSEENERLTAVINRMVREGVIRFEYSQDPALHPRDVLDHWRLLLTPESAVTLERQAKL